MDHPPPPPPPPPPQRDDPIITQFKPHPNQWELTDDNSKRINPQTGETILHNYCQYINSTPIEVYRYLIETEGCDINAQDKSKSTPLHRAFEYLHPTDGGDVAVLKYLLTQCNIEVDIRDKDGYTLLHTACDNINTLPLDIFKVLIETHGFDVNAQAIDKDTPLHHAFYYFDPNDSDITVLTYLLSQKNINVNMKGKRGNTLLHIACKYIKYFPLEVFKLLIETHGFDVNEYDNNNDTPLHFIHLNSDDADVNVLAYLINHKNVNVHTKNRNGHTLLHLACCNGSHSMCHVGVKAKLDGILCQAIELIAERYVEQVLDGVITPSHFVIYP
jgi:ankyrin repeat protein